MATWLISNIVVIRPRPSGAAALPDGRLLSTPAKVSPSLSQSSARVKFMSGPNKVGRSCMKNQKPLAFCMYIVQALKALICFCRTFWDFSNGIRVLTGPLDVRLWLDYDRLSFNSFSMFRFGKRSMLNFPYMEEAQMVSSLPFLSQHSTKPTRVNLTTKSSLPQAAFLQELDSGRPHTWASYPSFQSISG